MSTPNPIDDLNDAIDAEVQLRIKNFVRYYLKNIYARDNRKNSRKENRPERQRVR